MLGTILFWAAFAALGFAFALAVQMRVITAHVLRKALEAHDPALEPAQAGAAVVHAANGGAPAGAGDWLMSASAHLIETYPKPLSHLRIARRASLVMPVAILVLVAARRVLNGGL